MNNPLNRSMFRQAGMSKQPMGILASSPELMTTAQKAMNSGQPIKAQKAVSVDTKGSNNYLFGYQPEKTTFLQDIMNNFSYGSGPEKTYETKLVKEGEKIPTAVETTKYNNISGLFDKDVSNLGIPLTTQDNTTFDIMGTPLKDVSKVNNKYIKSLIPKKSDSSFIKDIKNIGRSIDGGYDTIIKKIDNSLDYFRNEAEKESAATNTLSGIQAELNAKAEGDPNYQYTDKSAGASSMLTPGKGERGLVDPEDVSKRPETPIPRLRPPEIAGLSVLNKIKNDAKNPNGTTTKGSDDALGISDLTFKDRVKARREIISEALGRDVSEKDVRTDVNYNLMMTGLLIAAGESPNAMTNIAKGLAGGLAGYGKAQGEATEARRKEEIAIGLAAVEQQFKSDEAQKARDKKPDSIRVAEMLQANPDLIPVLRSIKAKTGKTETELRAGLVFNMLKANFGRNPTQGEVDAGMGLILNIDTPGIPSVSAPVLRIPDEYRSEPNYQPGQIVELKTGDYKVQDDGLSMKLITKKS